jgi:hypothetical protein
MVKRSSNPAPAASEDVEMFIQLVRKYILDPQNFKRFLSNISKEDSRAFTEIKNLKKNGFSIFLQDKSSRFVIARADSVAAVDSGYAKLYDDDTMDILNSIDFWWGHSKQQGCRKVKLSNIQGDFCRTRPHGEHSCNY